MQTETGDDMRFYRMLAGWLLAAALALSAVAVPAQLVPGKDYLPVKPPQPTDTGNKVEVMEFFWYACPHCHQLQSPLRAWLKNKPSDVEFRRQPAAFQESWLQLAQTYYAFDSMNLVDKLHHELFLALHERRTLDARRLAKDPKALFDWVAERGVDRQKFIDTYQSFAVAGRVKRSLELTRNYDIPGTPAIVIDGRYLTAPSMTLKPDGTVDYERYFQVVDQVIAMARKNRGAK